MKKMGRKQRWTEIETKVLKNIYKEFTIKELMQVFPGRTEDGINSHIKRLKDQGIIDGGRNPETIERAMKERDLKIKKE